MVDVNCPSPESTTAISIRRRKNHKCGNCTKGSSSLFVGGVILRGLKFECEPELHGLDVDEECSFPKFEGKYSL